MAKVYWVCHLSFDLQSDALAAYAKLSGPAITAAEAAFSHAAFRQ